MKHVKAILKEALFVLLGLTFFMAPLFFYLMISVSLINGRF